jgi:DNA polymerase III subunit epsilon
MPLDSAAFCVVDVETTGLSAREDRVVEIAAIRCDATGQRVDEWHSLVDPDGPVYGTGVHGITDAMVADAPRFAEVAPRLLESLDGAVLVAHNAGFDRGFLREELAQVGIVDRLLPHLCTMHLRRHVGMPAPQQHRLAWACWQCGVPLGGAHAAVIDARATAGLLSHYLERARASGAQRVGDLAAGAATAASCGGPAPRIVGRPAPARLSARPVPSPPLRPARAPGAETKSVYRDALRAAVADFQLDPDEVDELHALVVDLGLGVQEIDAVHRSFISERLTEYLDDDELSWDELEQLRLLARLLAVDGRWLADLVEPVRPRHQSMTLSAAVASDVDDDALDAPLSVCFTGEFLALPLTRQEVQALAGDAGMHVKSGVSGALDVLVCLDPYSGTGKLRKAEANGTVVVDQDTFLALAGVRVGRTSDVLATIARRRRQRLAGAKQRAPKPSVRGRSASSPAPAATAVEQTLWCEAGSHEWRRPAQRGRPPKRCPEH